VRRLADALELEPAERKALLAAGHRPQSSALVTPTPSPVEPSTLVDAEH
jgi:hypothetical protein